MTPDSVLTQQSRTSSGLHVSPPRASDREHHSRRCLRWRLANLLGQDVSPALRRNLRLSQPRSWHEPWAIAALHTDVAALKTPHRRGNKANCDRRIGSAPSKRKGFDPDLDIRQPVCRFDSLDHPRPPTALAKTTHPNGCAQFQFLDLGRFHWSPPNCWRGPGSSVKARLQRPVSRAGLRVLEASRHRSGRRTLPVSEAQRRAPHRRVQW